MGSTKIEWTEFSWNPIRARDKATEKIGWHCEHASEGCRWCYAERTNKRLGTGLDFKPGYHTSGQVEVFLDEYMLLAPLRWKRPRMIFVCSMTDLFADFVTDEMIDRVFATMALCPQHTFQCLTKRSARMRAYLGDPNTKVRIWDAVCDTAILGRTGAILIAPGIDPDLAPPGRRVFLDTWPLRNCWIGVSAEDQENADARIPDLLATPAAVRFVSAEPLLGPLNLNTSKVASSLGGFEPYLAQIDWIIVGGESGGQQARPMVLGWAKEIVRQCQAAGIPVFMKQLGARPTNREGEPHPIKHRKGGDPAEWPAELRVREMPARAAS